MMLPPKVSRSTIAAHGLRPARSHEFRGETAGQEQGRVHGLGCWSDHGGRDAAGGNIHHPGQFDPADDTVVEFNSDVQWCGIDLHQFPRPDRIHGTERWLGLLSKVRLVRAEPVACRPWRRRPTSR